MNDGDPGAATSQRGDLISLGELVLRLRLNWRIWTAALLVSVCVAVAAGLLATRKYRATVIVLPAQNTSGIAGLAEGLNLGSLGGLASLAGFGSGGGGSAATALAVLKSRPFIDGFLSENKLIPALYGKPRNSESVVIGGRVPSAEDAYRRFLRSALTAAPEIGTGLIDVSVTWTDPETSAELANMIVARLNRTMAAKQAAESQSTIQYLNAELKKDNPIEVQESIYALIKNETRLIMRANTKRDFALQIIEPAVASDRRHYVWPNWPVLIVVAVAVGLMLGIFLALLRVPRAAASGAR